MKILFQSDVESLKALSSDNLKITVTDSCVSMRLLTVVSLSNYKALASGGRAGPEANFDTAQKALTVKLLQPNDLKRAKLSTFEGEAIHCHEHNGQYVQLSEDAIAREDFVALYPCDNWGTLVKLAKRLGGGKAKTFSSTTEAFKARNAKRGGHLRHWTREEIEEHEMDVYGCPINTPVRPPSDEERAIVQRERLLGALDGPLSSRANATISRRKM